MCCAVNNTTGTYKDHTVETLPYSIVFSLLTYVLSYLPRISHQCEVLWHMEKSGFNSLYSKKTLLPCAGVVRTAGPWLTRSVRCCVMTFVSDVELILEWRCCGLLQTSGVLWVTTTVRWLHFLQTLFMRKYGFGKTADLNFPRNCL